jgi:hypothetical protein
MIYKRTALGGIETFHPDLTLSPLNSVIPVFCKHFFLFISAVLKYF